MVAAAEPSHEFPASGSGDKTRGGLLNSLRSRAKQEPDADSCGPSQCPQVLRRAWDSRRGSSRAAGRSCPGDHAEATLGTSPFATEEGQGLPRPTQPRRGRTRIKCKTTEGVLPSAFEISSLKPRALFKATAGRRACLWHTGTSLPACCLGYKTSGLGLGGRAFLGCGFLRGPAGDMSRRGGVSRRRGRGGR